MSGADHLSTWPFCPTAPSLIRDRALIGSTRMDAGDGARFSVTDPATGERLLDVANCHADDARRAIAAAHTAWPAWRATPAKERANLLRRWVDLIHANADEPRCAARLNDRMDDIRWRSNFEAAREC